MAVWREPIIFVCQIPGFDCERMNEAQMQLVGIVHSRDLRDPRLQGPYANILCLETAYEDHHI